MARKKAAIASASAFPRYTTFSHEEKVKLLGGIPATRTSSPRGEIIKEHEVTVSYPDNTEGLCRYMRLGPDWHQFRYEYQEGDKLPKQGMYGRIESNLAAIEEKAKELATAAFHAAVERERKEYFQRAAEPSDGSRTKRPEKAQMSAKRAKEIAGKYALCRRLGEALLPIGAVFDSIEDANADWKEQTNPTLVVACCNRLDRCWEIPRFNPLNGDPDYRKETQK